MTKLFEDSEVFTKERPTKLTDQQREDFFNHQAQEIINNSWSGSDAEDIANDLASLNMSKSGYEKAKALESFGMTASYSIDSEFIEYLEQLESEYEDKIEENVKQWVLAHDIKPKLPEKQKLLIVKNISFNLKKDMTVYVTGIKETTACYYISQDVNRNGGMVIPFEIIEQRCAIKE